MEKWFEPVATLRTLSTDTRRWVCFAIYVVPNCLERKLDDPIYVRRAVWDELADRELLREQAGDAPTVESSYRRLDADSAAGVGKCLVAMEAAMGTFPFPVEGFEVFESPGQNATSKSTISQGTVRNRLRRSTRFFEYELNWENSSADSTDFGDSWRELIQFLSSLFLTSDQSPDQMIIEKYD